MKPGKTDRNTLRSNPIIKKYPILITLIVGLALSAVALFNWRDWEKQKIFLQFQRNADQHISAVNKQVGEIELILESVKSLYFSSKVVERDEFSEFVRPLLLRNPSVFAIEWLPRQTCAEPQEYIDATREYSFTQLNLDPFQPRQSIVEISGPDCFPVSFAESVEQKNNYLGTDLSLVENYHTAMDEARDTGRIIASNGLNIGPKKIDPLSFRVFLPIYINGAPLESTSDRRRYLLGFISGIFKIPEIIKNAWAELDNENLLIFIYVTGPSAEKHLLYTYPPSNSKRYPPPPTMTAAIRMAPAFETAALEEAGKRWDLLFVALPQYISNQQEWTVLGVPFIILFCSVLFSIFIQSLLNKKDQLSEANQKLKKEIHERKELTTKLQQAQKMESIGTLAGGIAHDFNNILGIIIGYGELIRMTDGPKNNNIQTSIDEILAASNRAKELVCQILTFSRLTDQKHQPIQLSYIIKESVKFLKASIPSSIEIRSQIDPETDIICANPTQMHQVLMNLCTNAAHAMKKGSGIMEITLENVNSNQEASQPYLNLNPGNYTKLTISDSGHGISAKHLDRIFDPYFTTKEKGEGTGLGLAVVHGIVKSHNGIISVESEEGRGTTFELFFPSAGPSTPMVEVDSNEHLPKGNERILLVDDEKQIVDIARRILTNLGYQVIGTTSSPAALETFKAQKGAFDLVITDLTMPKMNGFELAREIKIIKPDIAIILSTGFKKNVTESKLNNAGIKELIEKPFLPRDLAIMVRQVIDQTKKSGDAKLNTMRNNI